MWVNALPPLKVVQLLGNACLSPTTLAPKGPFRPRGPKWILWFSLDSVEPHRVNSNDLVGALGAGPRPEGVGRPAAWWRTSHDVLARLMFSSRADSFSPANRLHPHYQRANPSVLRASPFASVVYNNHRSFTYAASVAERNGLKPYGRNPPDHGLKPRGLRWVQTVKVAVGRLGNLDLKAHDDSGSLCFRRSSAMASRAERVRPAYMSSRPCRIAARASSRSSSNEFSLIQRLIPESLFVEHDFGESSGSAVAAARRAGYQGPDRLGPCMSRNV